MDGTASSAERLLIEKWYEEKQEGQPPWLVEGSEKSNEIQKALLDRILNEYEENKYERSQAPLRSFIFSYKWLAAASIVILGVAIVLFRLWKDDREIGFENRQVYEIRNNNSLRLADGQSVYLDSLLDVGLVDNNFLISRTEDGSLIFQVIEQKSNDPTWNTISTDEGGMYKIMLPDSTLMWLNASSSVTFPSSFSNGKREVVLVGEAYFDVRHHENMPFSVVVSEKSDTYPSDPDMRIEVLGTQFNVSAYPDNESIQATLLEGSVKVKDKFGSLYMRPNQRVVIHSKNDPMKLEEAEDLNVVVAWKDGYFQFVDTSVEQMMKEVGRWYGVKVNYPDGIPPYHYTGKLSRKMGIESLIEALNLSDINCQLTNGQLIVYNINQSK